MMTYSIVITACSHEEEGKTLARKIVENKLAACVQISHIQSTYYWKNAAQNESEYNFFFVFIINLYSDSFCAAFFQ